MGKLLYVGEVYENGPHVETMLKDCYRQRGLERWLHRGSEVGIHTLLTDCCFDHNDGYNRPSFGIDYRHGGTSAIMGGAES